MASTYSNLKIELIGTGDQSGSWGVTTNTNLGTALEEAIVGSADVTFASGDVTITLTDTNVTQTARNLRLNCTGTTGGSTRNLILGSGCQIEKPYLINNGCADAITVKNTTGTGITVPAGKSMWVYNNGTNVVDAVTHLSSLTLGSALPIASGGTNSTATPTAGGVAYGTGTAYAVTSAGTAGYVLTSGGASLPTWTQATNTNTASTIVQRDASGNFSAGTITATLNGNASTATSATSASSATTATTATNLAGGSAGTVPYQTSAGATAMLGAGSLGQVLTSNGAAAPSWTTPPTISSQTTTSGSSNITLTSSSNPLQNVTMTAVGKYVQLPSATTLSIGGPKFVIGNKGATYSFGIRDNAGTLVAALEPGQTVACYLTSTATAAGVWVIEGEYSQMLVTVDATTSDAPYYTYGGFLSCNLDDTKSIHCVGTSKVVAVDNATNALGTAVSVGGTTRAIYRVSSTTALVIYDNDNTNFSGSGTAYQYFARVVTLSGATTLTLGTAVSSTTAASRGSGSDRYFPVMESGKWQPAITQLSSTSFLLVGNGSSSYNWVGAVVMTVSGTTVTLGSETQISDGSTNTGSYTSYQNPCIGVWKLSSSAALAVFRCSSGVSGNNNAHSACVLSISGTTITVGTTASVPASLGQWSGYNGFPGIVQFSSTLFGYMCNGQGSNTETRVYPINISGTSVSFGNYYSVGGAGYGVALFRNGNDGGTIGRSAQIVIPMSATSGLIVTGAGYYNYTNSMYTFYLSGSDFVGYASYGNQFGPSVNFWSNGYPNGSAYVCWFADGGIYKDSKNADSYGTPRFVNALAVNWAPVTSMNRGYPFVQWNNLANRQFSPIVFSGTSTTPTLLSGKPVHIADDGSWDGNSYDGQSVILNNNDRILLPGLGASNLYLLRGTDLQCVGKLPIRIFRVSGDTYNPQFFNCLIPVGPQRIVYFMYDQGQAVYRCISVETTVG